MAVSLAILNGATMFLAPALLSTNLIQVPTRIIQTSTLALLLFTLTTRTKSIGSKKEYLKLIAKILANFAGCAVVFHVVAVLFGAHFIQNIEMTASWAAWMSAMLLPLLLAIDHHPLCVEGWKSLIYKQTLLQSHTSKLVWSAIFLLAGNWLACFVIPLDWGRAWQIWPIPNIVVGSAGYAIGALFASILSGYNCVVGRGECSELISGRTPVVNIDLTTTKKKAKKSKSNTPRSSHKKSSSSSTTKTPSKVSRSPSKPSKPSTSRLSTPRKAKTESSPTKKTKSPASSAKKASPSKAASTRKTSSPRRSPSKSPARRKVSQKTPSRTTRSTSPASTPRRSRRNL